MQTSVTHQVLHKMQSSTKTSLGMFFYSINALLAPRATLPCKENNDFNNNTKHTQFQTLQCDSTDSDKLKNNLSRKYKVVARATICMFACTLWYKKLNYFMFWITQPKTDFNNNFAVQNVEGIWHKNHEFLYHTWIMSPHYPVKWNLVHLIEVTGPRKMDGFKNSQLLCFTRTWISDKQYPKIW